MAEFIVTLALAVALALAIGWKPWWYGDSG
jgi:hypothetical protein